MVNKRPEGRAAGKRPRPAPRPPPAHQRRPPPGGRTENGLPSQSLSPSRRSPPRPVTNMPAHRDRLAHDVLARLRQERRYEPETQHAPRHGPESPAPVSRPPPSLQRQSHLPPLQDEVFPSSPRQTGQPPALVYRPPPVSPPRRVRGPSGIPGATAAQLIEDELLARALASAGPRNFPSSPQLGGGREQPVRELDKLLLGDLPPGLLEELTEEALEDTLAHLLETLRRAPPQRQPPTRTPSPPPQRAVATSPPPGPMPLFSIPQWEEATPDRDSGMRRLPNPVGILTTPPRPATKRPSPPPVSLFGLPEDPSLQEREPAAGPRLLSGVDVRSLTPSPVATATPVSPRTPQRLDRSAAVQASFLSQRPTGEGSPPRMWTPPSNPLLERAASMPEPKLATAAGLAGADRSPPQRPPGTFDSDDEDDEDRWGAPSLRRRGRRGPPRDAGVQAWRPSESLPRLTGTGSRAWERNAFESLSSLSSMVASAVLPGRGEAASPAHSRGEVIPHVGRLGGTPSEGEIPARASSPGQNLRHRHRHRPSSSRQHRPGERYRQAPPRQRELDSDEETLQTFDLDAESDSRGLRTPSVGGGDDEDDTYASSTFGGSHSSSLPPRGGRLSPGEMALRGHLLTLLPTTGRAGPAPYYATPAAVAARPLAQSIGELPRGAGKTAPGTSRLGTALEADTSGTSGADETWPAPAAAPASALASAYPPEERRERLLGPTAQTLPSSALGEGLSTDSEED